MEMPVDILTHRLGKMVDYGVNIPDPTATAIDLDEELQQKFLFFPIEELEAVEIEDDRGVLNAGDGPEHCAARPGENPAWLLNHARNALALYWKLSQQAKREQAEAKKRSQRPLPGVYSACHPGARDWFTIVVTAEQRIVVPMQAGDLCDQTDIFDSFEEKHTPWRLTPINITEGTYL